MARTAASPSTTIRRQEEGVFSRFGENGSFNALGGMVFPIWRTVQEALNNGVAELDLGRSPLALVAARAGYTRSRKALSER